MFVAQSIWMTSYNLRERQTFMLIVSVCSVAFAALLLVQGWRFLRIRQRLSAAKVERLEDLHEASHNGA